MSIMKESKLVVLREYDSINDAQWDKSLLDSADIYSTINNEVMSAVYPVGFAPAQLLVRSADRLAAEEILQAYAGE